MNKGRLEAFSDGVLAIIITIMVLELRVPHDTTFAALCSLAPIFLCYAMSFIFIGIYWTNHHHLLQAAQKVSGPVLWANLHLLFWLSLIPFFTAWLGENGAAALPVAIYGGVLLCAGIAYFILTRSLLGVHDKNSKLAIAIGQDFKGKISIVIYALAIALAFVHPAFAYVLYGVVAVMWLVPDRRIESVFK